MTLWCKILPTTIGRMLRTVAVLLIDGVSPFEFGTICEVFGVDRTEDGVPPIELRVCGEQQGKPVITDVGVLMTPQYGLDGLDGVDLVAAPAVAIRDTYPPAVLDALRAASARGAMVLTVCSGAFLLAASGLLDGRRCTTHWRHVEEFCRRFPAVEVDPDVLFVDDGDIVTSAGTAAGIDACLHLVRRELGSAVATIIARRMVVPPQRDGGQQQFLELPMPECTGDSLQPVLTWMLETIAAEHTVAELARRAQMSERTFARRFVAETGTTPTRWLSLQRVLHARRLLEETTLGVEEVAKQTGFSTSALLRHHFHKIVGVAPNDYRRTFSDRPVGVPSNAVGGGPAVRGPEGTAVGGGPPVRGPE
jgi:transcriptional regulator GlxA family with amidase domain